jgi:hypothetical protein
MIVVSGKVLATGRIFTESVKVCTPLEIKINQTGGSTDILTATVYQHRVYRVLPTRDEALIK